MHFGVECVERGCDQAHHPDFCSEGGGWSGVRGNAGLGICGNEGPVIHLFQAPFDCDHLI